MDNGAGLMLSEILILGAVVIIAITVFVLILGRRQQQLTSTDIATLFQTHQQLMSEQASMRSIWRMTPMNTTSNHAV